MNGSLATTEYGAASHRSLVPKQTKEWLGKGTTTADPAGIHGVVMMRIQSVVLLFFLFGVTGLCHAQEPPTLYAVDAITKLADHDSQREKFGRGYTGTRRYVLENHRLNKRAEMLVSVKCDPDGTKHFEVVSEEGWKPANKRVLWKMLESEKEASLPQRRPMTSLTLDNYRFQMLGRDLIEARPTYILQVLPKREDKYLFEGRIWVDAEDFAVVRVEGKPAKNAPFWIRSVNFVQKYQKSGTFWFPLSTESVSEARLFGTTRVTITYFDYQLNVDATPSSSVKDLIERTEINHGHN